MSDMHSADSAPIVVCLHASASSSRQWAALGQLLEPHAAVLAPDLVGYGRGMPFVATQAFGFDKEIDNLLRQLGNDWCERGGRLHLVGHSYGAATALEFALRFPHSVASLCLFEPVLFNLLADDERWSAEAGEIRTVGNQVRAKAGRRFGRSKAARRFVEYWSGKGAWQFIPAARRQRFSRLMPKVAAEFEAIVGSTATLVDLGRLDVPVRLMYGTGSRAPARAVAYVLGHGLRRVESIEVPGVGHMAPVTNPELINPLIVEHLQRYVPSTYRVAA
jgi:pimeloyl-ACP methyl ester carboxylesterase